MTTIKKKFTFIKRFSDLYIIKTGVIYKEKKTGECYKTRDWFSFLYRIYTDFLLIIILMVVLFIYLEDHFDNLYLSMPLTALLHLSFECFLLILMPLEKVNCWEKNLEDKA